MISERKLIANRLNAQKSTGPRTADGKARSSANSIKHGVFCRGDVVLPGESQAEHDALREALIESVDPRDAIEWAIVERMLVAQWKLRRISDTQRKQHENEAKAAIQWRESEYCRCQISGLKKHERAAALAASEQRELVDWLTVSPATLMQRRLSTWDEMSRHEQRLENQFFKAVRELRQWRKAREKQCAQETENEPTVDADDAAAFAPLPVLRERLGEGSAQHASTPRNEANRAEPSPQPSPGAPGEGEIQDDITPVVQNEPTVIADAPRSNGELAKPRSEQNNNSDQQSLAHLLHVQQVVTAGESS